MNQLCLRFYETVEDNLLTFAVIAARYREKWIFCRHRERETWEIPGGHRESGENITDTARRELWEETGAEEFMLKPLTVYSVQDGDLPESFGKLYYADISRLGSLPPLEIAEIQQSDTLPERLTYPAIQPKLLALAEVFLKEQQKGVPKP